MLGGSWYVMLLSLCVVVVVVVVVVLRRFAASLSVIKDQRILKCGLSDTVILGIL